MSSVERLLRSASLGRPKVIFTFLHNAAIYHDTNNSSSIFMLLLQLPRDDATRSCLSSVYAL